MKQMIMIMSLAASLFVAGCASKSVNTEETVVEPVPEQTVAVHRNLKGEG